MGEKITSNVLRTDFELKSAFDHVEFQRSNGRKSITA